jgi:hypothetical protein
LTGIEISYWQLWQSNSGMLFHNEQYLGIEHSYAEKFDGPFKTFTPSHTRIISNM